MKSIYNILLDLRSLVAVNGTLFSEPFLPVPKETEGYANSMSPTPHSSYDGLGQGDAMLNFIVKLQQFISFAFFKIAIVLDKVKNNCFSLDIGERLHVCFIYMTHWFIGNWSGRIIHTGINTQKKQT